MSFGGRFMSVLFDFEDCLRTLKNYKKPYRNSVLHYDDKEVILRLKRIKKILDETTKEIEKQALQGAK